ncbi:MAG TPA: DUF1566 domain-containing protein [Desulfuromonadaceae bacterium]
MTHPRFVCFLLFAALMIFTVKPASTATIQLPQTGQTSCYDTAGIAIPCVGTGQDGELRIGVAWPTPRFSDNSDQTMTDNLTGLIWAKLAYNGGGTNTWQAALNTINTLNSSNYMGHSDWRLPNRNELKSLVNIQQSNTADWLNSQGFINVVQDFYWSSSTNLDIGTAFTVNMQTGTGPILVGNKYNGYYGWPVRGGQLGALTLPKTGQTSCWGSDGYWRPCSGTEDGAVQSGTAWPTPRFTDNSKANPADLTMTDNLTGLVWTKSGSITAPKSTWQQALDYIKTLNSGNYLGHSDWRLPNLNELDSLIHIKYKNTPYQLSQQGFTNVAGLNGSPGLYGSSSSCASDTSKFWFMQPAATYESCMSKASPSYPYISIWPVRDGQGSTLVISISPANRDFGSVTINTASSGQTFTISNSGTADLVISSINLTGGNNSMFSLITGDGTGGTCGSAKTLTPASSCSCTISATFTPTSTGAKYTTLRISSNDPINPAKDVVLSGNGIPVTYTISTSVIGSGNITCNSPVSSGDVSVCSITPNNCYRSATFTDNNIDMLASVANNNYSIYNVSTDHAIIGSFALNTPVITWTNPAAIAYGTTLSATQLNATANVAGVFVYTPATGTLLNAGSQTLSVTFTPSDPAYCTTATKTVMINVTKITPSITWANPSDIVYGTALSATELNATASVAGTFVYTPVVGTVLNGGTQMLNVTFTPMDNVNYTNQTATVNLTVNKANQTIAFPAIVTKSVGDPDFNPGATVSSGLPVTYTSSDTSVATISGGLIHIVGGGTATITAYQAGNANYNPAVSQTQSLKITGPPSKKPFLTINTLADGTTTNNATLNITGNVNGLKKNDTITINITNNGTTTSKTVAVAFPSGDFSDVVTMGNGENVIEIVATNKWGTTTERRTIILQSP